jgi:hypothetical protein
MDLATKLSQFEQGAMDEQETIELFSHLLNTGIIYSLQGSYQRTAQSMIQAGVIGGTN